VLYYVQDKILFHPIPLPATHAFKFAGKFEEVNIPFNKTDTLNLIRFLPDGMPRKGIVVFFHGNRGNVERYARYASFFTSRGYELWMPDYPGFGKSVGKRTERKMNEQAYQVYRMAAARIHPDSIIIYGKSFGTGIATCLAANASCKQLILETPYQSIPALFGYYAFLYPVNRMVTYKLPVRELLSEVKAPICIFHGTDDGVIPYRHAKVLAAELKATDRFITLENGNHHNLAGFPLYQQAMDTLLK
jgi:alpha-beta hydrolase superfamily lysophospholipase